MDSMIEELKKPAEPGVWTETGYRVVMTDRNFSTLTMIKAKAIFESQTGEPAVTLAISGEVYERICSMMHVLAVPKLFGVKVSVDLDLPALTWELQGPEPEALQAALELTREGQHDNG